MSAVHPCLTSFAPLTLVSLNTSFYIKHCEKFLHTGASIKTRLSQERATPIMYHVLASSGGVNNNKAPMLLLIWAIFVAQL